MSFWYVLVFMMEQGAVIELETYTTKKQCQSYAAAASTENWRTVPPMVKGHYFCIPRPAY